ncbi:MAG TPA: hypothetical protein DCO79_06695 [Spirochaeta sp.]|nr:hypothetical protein [Spirochaeta sp.]
MDYIIFSTAGFISLLLSDILQISKKRILIIPLSIIGYLSIILITILLTSEYSFHSVSPPVLTVKIIFAALSFIGLVYVLFVEIHLASQFAAAGSREVYSGGSYGIVRHPGFYFFALLFAALNTIVLNREYLLISLYLIVLDFLLILIEDIIIFPRIFSNYKNYKKKVPFLIPGMKR